MPTLSPTGTDQVECESACAFPPTSRARLPVNLQRFWTSPGATLTRTGDGLPLNCEAFWGSPVDNGVDPSAPIVYYCIGGGRCAYTRTVQTHSGHQAARNHVGGMPIGKNMARANQPARECRDPDD